MAFFSISAGLLIKGVMAIINSGKVAAIATKIYGAAHAVTAGQVIAAATTTAATVGVGVAIKDSYTNSTEGFSKMHQGLKEGSISTFLEGIDKLRKSFNSANLIIDNFDVYIDQNEPNPEYRRILKDGVKEFRGYIEDEITGQTINMIREVENHLKKYQLTYKEYTSQVDQIYDKYLKGLQNNSQEYILAQAGKVYDEITILNHKVGLKNNYEEYDHFLAYCIAGYIIKQSGHALLFKSQDKLASDITNNIFSYIRSRNASLISSKFGKENYDNNIQAIYKHYFNEDVNDYKILISKAGKVYDEINSYNLRMGKRKVKDGFDNFMVYVMAGWIINNLTYPYIKKLNQDQLAKDIGNSILGYISQGQKICPELLLSNYFSKKNYQANILFIYKHYFNDKIANFNDLLSQAGKVYNEISSYNIRVGYQIHSNKFDHEMVYYMAGWIVDNKKSIYPFLTNMAQHSLASSITNNIFNYLR